MSRMIEILHRSHGARRRHAIDLAVPAGDRHAGRVRSAYPTRLPHEAASAGNAALTNRTPKLVDPPQQPSAQFLGLDDQALSAYQRLYAQVRNELDATGPRCICITSSQGGEGKTSTVINLAFVAAQASDQRVLVVDANLRRPQLAKRLGLSMKVGLSDLLIDGLFPSQAIRWVAPVGYSVLAAGRVTEEELSLLDNRRMGILLRDLKESYDLTIVDAPHVVDQSIANQLSRLFDAVFVVVEMQRTRRQAVDRVIRMLQRGGAIVRGCILTQNGKLDGILGEPTQATITRKLSREIQPDEPATVPEEACSGSAAVETPPNAPRVSDSPAECISRIPTVHEPVSVDAIPPLDIERIECSGGSPTPNTDDATTSVEPQPCIPLALCTGTQDVDHDTTPAMADQCGLDSQPASNDPLPPESGVFESLETEWPDESNNQNTTEYFSQEDTQADGLVENMEVALERWVQSFASEPVPAPIEISLPFSGPMLEESEEPETKTKQPSLRYFPPEAPEDTGSLEDLADETNSKQNNSGSANVLAICGVLLILAGLLYVAVDVVNLF